MQIIFRRNCFAFRMLLDQLLGSGGGVQLGELSVNCTSALWWKTFPCGSLFYLFKIRPWTCVCITNEPSTRSMNDAQPSKPHSTQDGAHPRPTKGHLVNWIGVHFLWPGGGALCNFCFWKCFQVWSSITDKKYWSDYKMLHVILHGETQEMDVKYFYRFSSWSS